MSSAAPPKSGLSFVRETTYGVAPGDASMMVSLAFSGDGDDPPIPVMSDRLLWQRIQELAILGSYRIYRHVAAKGGRLDHLVREAEIRTWEMDRWASEGGASSGGR